MHQTYKKAMDIEYNHKIFTIFIDENNRCTFLEKDKKGEYIYPTLEDFQVLNHIYNYHNYFIEEDLRKYSFNEKVRVISGALAMTISLAVITHSLDSSIKNLFKVYHLTEEEETLTLIAENVTPDLKLVSDLKELDDILGYQSVTKSDIMTAANNNPNLNEYKKEIINNLINKVYEEYPNIDLRVFYENVKTLEIVELTEEEYQEKFGNSEANYDSINNRINLSPNANLATIYHELAHVMWSFYWPNFGVYRASSNNALNEAMTNYIKNIISARNISYQNEGLILDYLLSFTNYTYEDYMNYGIEGLMSILKKDYPSIDFNYISKCVDIFKDTTLNLGTSIYLSSCSDLLDELFSLSLLNIEENNPYESFSHFSLLLDESSDLLYNYLEKYNNKLNELGYQVISVEELDQLYKKYSEFSKIAITYDKKLYLSAIGFDELDNYQVQILEDQTVKELDPNNIDSTTSFRHFPFYFSLAYLKYNAIFGTNEFYQKLIADYGNINTMEYKEIPIYMNGELLCTERIDQLDISIGKNKEGESAYLITNQIGNIIYASDQSLFNLSNSIHLKSYISNYTENADQIELSYVLNDPYLFYFEKESQVFRNITIKDETLTISPMYTLTVEEEGIFYLADLYIINTEVGVLLQPLGYPLDIKIDETIDLYDVFEYDNILNENQIDYVFSLEQIKELINNYVEDLQETKAR